jgi:hypothetical protein
LLVVLVGVEGLGFRRINSHAFNFYAFLHPLS